MSFPNRVGLAAHISTHSSVVDFIASMIGRFERRIIDKRLVVEVDVDPSVQDTHRSQLPHQEIQDLLSLAIERCPAGGEILITAVQTRGGVEIEIADSAEDTPAEYQQHRLAAFRPTALKNATASPWPANSATSGSGTECRVYCARCPQGGLAWTIVQPERTAARRSA